MTNAGTARQDLFRAQGRCRLCGQEPPAPGRVIGLTCLAHIREAQRRRRMILRRRVAVR